MSKQYPEVGVILKSYWDLKFRADCNHPCVGTHHTLCDYTELWSSVDMIIKSIFRKYEKWNPVHPTHGAFWGIGVGIGCGVGWGPGFGPEVIGYVGSGCGVGFSVGITFLGLGIGLPANHLLDVPHNAFQLTRRGALDVARAGGLLGNRPNGQQYPFESFPSFKTENWGDNVIDLPYMKTMLVSRANHITDCLHGISRCIFPWDKGPKN